MIFSNSRYTQSLVTEDSQAIQIAIKKTLDVTKRTTTISTKSGDTFERIAAHVLGDSTQYWRIANLNPSIRFPDIIPTNTILTIPLS